ncbi:SAP domain-containing protein [Streptomyces sp. NPDC050704]|uniref:SAP domain-containing protein n=1 Tax=Streptomyces sp. NPDC050704 TaxID=3157219 RepID=UPI0034257A6C
MDYEQMTTPQLQAECKRRGLPSGRVKAELVERLTAADTEDEAVPVAESPDVADSSDTPTVILSDGEQVPQPDVTVDAQPDLLPPAPEPFETHEPEPAAPASFRRTWLLGPGGLDEATHTQLRQQTREAAVAAGHTPRGDAYRVGTTADGEVYEINVRRRS